MSDALKSNTTLIVLDLSGDDKKDNTQMASINNPHFFIPIKSTDNSIGDTGASSLSDALKSNKTLTQLYLRREHKRNNAQMASINNQLFSFFAESTGNMIGDAGRASLRDALKSNTTLTKLNLSGEDKRNNANDTSTIHSFFHFHQIQQGTTLETQE